MLYVGRLFIETGLFQSKRVRSNMCHWSSSPLVRAMEKNKFHTTPSSLQEFSYQAVQLNNEIETIPDIGHVARDNNDQQTSRTSFQNASVTRSSFFS
jgi:hypothetical protein